MVPKEGHIGQFPANFCVKLAGTNADTGETLVSRTCVLEDMNSQCGLFKFQNSTMNGCILTCDFDGCNLSPPLLTASSGVALGAILHWLLTM